LVTARGLLPHSHQHQSVDNGRAWPRVGECLCPRREWLVGGDRDRRTFLAFGENLKQQFRSAPIQLQIPEFVDEDQINAAVAIDQLGELFVVGGFDQFVDQLAGQGVADSSALLSASRKYDRLSFGDR
jgi:hypothetical protein